MERLVPVLALGGALLLWSGAFPLISTALTGFGPLPLALARLAIASLVFVPLVVAGRVHLPVGRDLVRASASGVLLLGVYSAALNLGEDRISPSLAGLLVATAPVFVLALQGRRVAGVSRLVGVTVIVLGCLVGSVGAGLGHLDLVGAAWVLLAAAAEAGALVLAGTLTGRYSPVALTAVGVWASTAVPSPWAVPLAHELGSVPSSALAAAVSLGLGPTLVAYLLLAVAARALSPALLTAGFAILPASTALVSRVLLGTPLPPSMVLAAVITGTGILVLERAEHPGPG